MATVASKMTALANEVREISGATNKFSIDAMTTHLDAANAEITEQESIIADMNEVLDNLGAESVGGGSGGGSVETAEVTVEGCQYVFYTGYENGQIVGKTSVGDLYTSEHTIVTLHNSVIACVNLGAYEIAESTGAEMLEPSSLHHCRAFKITNTTAKILFYSHTGGGE